MKFLNKITPVVTVLTFIACSQESSELEQEIIAEDYVPLVTEISNLPNQSGISISGNTVTFTQNYTIPEDVILSFLDTDKIVVNSGVVLTINAAIVAGNYKIFEIVGDGKINGCPQIEYLIPQWWGTDDTGASSASILFQRAIESFPCVKKFKATGEFLIDKEILLNVDGRYYDFNGSTFTGVTTGTDNGGLITIGSRDFNISENYSVIDVVLEGGTYIPKYNHDNSLGILNAKNIKISNVIIDGSLGLRGIALQNPNQQLVSNPIIESVIISNVMQNGGVNVMNIDLNNGLAQNIIVSNVIGNNIDETNPQNNNKEAAFRISSGDDLLRIKNVNISSVVLDDLYQGFQLKGVKANISDVEINNVSYRGINIQFPDVINFNNVNLIGELTTTDGIVGVGASSSLSNNVNFSNVSLSGKFNQGIWNNASTLPMNFSQLSIHAEFSFGIKNFGKNCSFEGLIINGDFGTGISNKTSGSNSTFQGTIKGNQTIGLENEAEYCQFNLTLDGDFSTGISNETSGTNSTFQVTLKGNQTTGVENQAEYCRFNLNLDGDFGNGIYNLTSAANCAFKGNILGNYNNGFINGGKACQSSFNFNGEFLNAAIFTFYNVDGYSSSYKAFINFKGSNSNHINQYRNDDFYEIYVYDSVIKEYILNP